MTGHSDRMMRNAGVGQPFGDGSASGVILGTQGADQFAGRCRREAGGPSRLGRRAMPLPARSSANPMPPAIRGRERWISPRGPGQSAGRSMTIDPP